MLQPMWQSIRPHLRATRLPAHISCAAAPTASDPVLDTFCLVRPWFCEMFLISTYMPGLARTAHACTQLRNLHMLQGEHAHAGTSSGVGPANHSRISPNWAQLCLDVEEVDHIQLAPTFLRHTFVRQPGGGSGSGGGWEVRNVNP